MPPCVREYSGLEESDSSCMWTQADFCLAYTNMWETKKIKSVAVKGSFRAAQEEIEKNELYCK